MALDVAAMSLVSPLGLSPGEHVFFLRAEVSPHASGAFVDRDGEALPIHHCPWIPLLRPWASRIRLLARQALSRVGPIAPGTPVFLIAPRAALDGEAELARFLGLAGQTITRSWTGAAAYVSALAAAEEALKSAEEVVIVAVDTLLSPAEVERWQELRYSAFTRNPLPPSEGAAALRLVQAGRTPLAGKVHAFASARSEATDENDLLTDGAALTRVLAELPLPGPVPLVVGPRDVDPLRIRDFHLASVRHHAKLDRAEMPSLEGRIGLFGSAGGLMSAVFALAWLQHGIPLPGNPSRRVAVAWARSADGTLGATLVGDERS